MPLGVRSSGLVALLLPEPLEMVCIPQINGDSDDVCVFHRLLNLYVLVGEDLDLLAIVPEAGVKAIQQNGRLGPVHILKTDIVCLIAEAYKYLL